jgi:glycosyltransferase involved in cell wall biosynthesis
VKSKKITFSIHITNVLGLGAQNVIYPFVIYLSKKRKINIDKIYFGENINNFNISSLSKKINIKVYKRILPNSFSRLLEILFFKPNVNSNYLLVLGDIPISRHKSQILFLHSTLVVQTLKGHNFILRFKYFVLRFLFLLNMPNIKLVIVQTQIMKSLLLNKFPNLKVDVLPPPCLDLYKKNKSVDRKKIFTNKSKLTGFYPAMFYDHKNHKILNNINFKNTPVKKIILTIDPINSPNSTNNIFQCIGNISPDKVLKYYLDSDFLLFLSATESYGLPLIEAMTLNIPIICPNLPYAWELCQDQAIYFNFSQAPDSINKSIITLRNKLANGWRPNYSNALSHIHSDWDNYVDTFLKKIHNFRNSENG